MKKIKTQLGLIILITAIFAIGIVAQETQQTSAFASSAEGIGLDLNAVAEVFKDSKNLEDFEHKLNNEESGINNVDLDENGEIDYLRVVENVEGDTHLVSVQSVLAEDQFQDVAALAVEKDVNGYNFQVQGTPTLYGANYYVVPRATNLSNWNVINWMYRPNYSPYRSVYGWRTYPRSWRVRRPVPVNTYRTKTVRYVGRKNFTPSQTVRVKTVKRVRYNPRTSTLVKKKRVVRSNGNKTVVTKKGTKTRTRTNANGRTVKKTKGVKVRKNKNTGKTTVTKGKKKTVKNQKGKKTTVKKVKKRKKKN